MQKIVQLNSRIKRFFLYGIVFSISFCLQIIFILHFKGNPVAADAQNYYEISQNILTHKASLLGGEINVRRPPFYPFFLASVFYMFGNKIIVAQIVQALLIAISCMVIFRLGEIIFNERVGLVAAILTAVHPVLVASSFSLLTEALSIFLIVILAYILTYAFIKEKTFLFILSGLFIGMVTLTKPVLIVFPFFLTFILFLRYKFPKAIKYAVFLIIPSILVISAWTVRNYYHTKLFIPIALGGELEVWNGSYIPGDGHSDHPNTRAQRDILYQRFEEKNKLSENYLKNGNGKQYYLYYLEMQDFKREGIANILAHPFRYIALFPKKIAYLYIGSYCYLFGINDSFRSLFSAPGATQKNLVNHIFVLFAKSSVLLLSLIIFIFFVSGLWLNMKNKKFLAIFSISIYWTLFFLLFSPISRYSMPIIPLMVLTALGAVQEIFSRIKGN